MRAGGIQGNVDTGGPDFLGALHIDNLFRYDADRILFLLGLPLHKNRLVFPQEFFIVHVAVRKHDDLRRAMKIFNLHKGHQVAFFRPQRADSADQSADPNGGLVGDLTQGKGIDVGKFGDDVFVPVQGMAAEIKSERFLLQGQGLAGLPFRYIGQAGGIDRRCRCFNRTEQPHLRIGLFLLNPLTVFEGLFQGGHHLGTFVAQAVEGAAFDQAFDDALVDPAQIDAGTEIQQRFESAALLTLGHNRVNGRFANIFYGDQSISDFVVVNLECGPAVVDVRRQDVNGMAATLGHVLDDAIRGMHFTGQQGGQEFDGKVGLEIGGLVGDQRIGRTVGFIEPITAELLHQVEYRFGLIFRNVVFPRAGHETVPVLGHLRGDFFAHGLAQVIRFGHGIIGQIGGNLHDLFLVENDAVSFL